MSFLLYLKLRYHCHCKVICEKELLLKVRDLLNKVQKLDFHLCGHNIKFFDILGREISVIMLSNSNGDLKLHSYNTLNKGSYFLRISDSNNNSVIKHLIKQ